MPVNKTLSELFGVGAVQTATDFTIVKASLSSNRIPAAFPALNALSENTAESLLVALLSKFFETQDTSNDAEVAIYSAGVNLVELVTDGVVTPYEQYLFTVRVLNKKQGIMPNPNLV